VGTTVPIKWKRSNGLARPEIALEELSESITIDAKNQVSFTSDFEHHERVSNLETLLSFPESFRNTIPAG
jgi:hypothetical protein